MLWDTIRADLTAAMKGGDTVAVSTLRMLVSELDYKRIELRRDLTDGEVIGVVAKEVQKRREAIEAYTKGGRVESARREEEELGVLQRYLPPQLSESEVRSEVVRLLSGIAGLDFGAAMKIVAPAMKGRAEGSLVARVVREVVGG